MVFICSYMFLVFLFGYLGDWYNSKLIMCVGIFFWFVVMFVSLFIGKDYFWVLLLMWGLVGVGEVSYFIIVFIIIVDFFVKEKSINMLFMFYFVILVGSGMGYIVGLKVDIVVKDWYWVFWVIFGLGLLVVFFLMFVV